MTVGPRRVPARRSRPSADVVVTAIVGPTAVGKSLVGVAMAGQPGLPPGEVVSADAMQLYRGMRVGTATLSDAEMCGVAHHLIGIWPVTRAATVTEYRELARGVIAEVSRRGHRALLVGGSGLYVSATLDDLEFPGTDPEVRRRWQHELDLHGPGWLHRELLARDAGAAAAIDPANGRRLVRALEVVEMTGSFRARLPDPIPEFLTARRVGLFSPWQDIDARIRARVVQMWRDGLLDEVRCLVADGLTQDTNAGKAIGYAEVLAHLHGTATADEARAAIETNTRRLARRQMRWFRRDLRITWWEVRPDADVAALAADITAGVGASPVPNPDGGPRR